MLFTMAGVKLFFGNIFGWIVAHPKQVLMIVAGIVLIILLIFAYRGCKRERTMNIDVETLQKISKANEAQRRAEITKIVKENQDLVKTVDGRTLDTIEDVEERDRLIKEKVDEINKEVQETKMKKGDATAEELECLLVGDC